MSAEQIKEPKNSTAEEFVEALNHFTVHTKDDLVKREPPPTNKSNVIPISDTIKEKQENNLVELPNGVLQSVRKSYLNHFFTNRQQSESGSEVYSNMENSNKDLINRLDQDIRDHKQEVRERDNQLRQEAKEREERFREDLKQMQQEALVREERIRLESKEREDRILKAIEASNTALESKFTDVNESVKRSEIRIDETSKHIHSMIKQNFWGWIGAIIAVIAICATVYFGILSNINSDPPAIPVTTDISTELSDNETNESPTSTD